MRASIGTNLGLVLSVVACTKSKIACFAGPSFHDDRGSPAACAVEVTPATNAPATGSAARPVRPASTARRPTLIRPEASDTTHHLPISLQPTCWDELKLAGGALG